MPGRHIILLMRDDDIIHKNNSNKKNRCISKKIDYLSCVKNNYVKDKLNSNKCRTLFWNWFKNCNKYR